MNEANLDEENSRATEDPRADLEMMYIDEYLRAEGVSIKELHTLPEQEARRLMTKASQYSSLKLADLESRARLRTKIRNASDFT